jgi:hypothetical protein
MIDSVEFESSFGVAVIVARATENQHREFESQKGTLSPEKTKRIGEMPKKTVVAISRAPSELKPQLYDSAIEHDLSERSIKELVSSRREKS